MQDSALFHEDVRLFTLVVWGRGSYCRIAVWAYGVQYTTLLITIPNSFLTLQCQWDVNSKVWWWKLTEWRHRYIIWRNVHVHVWGTWSSWCDWVLFVIWIFQANDSSLPIATAREWLVYCILYRINVYMCDWL